MEAEKEDMDSESFYLVNKGGNSVPHGEDDTPRNRFVMFPVSDQAPLVLRLMKTGLLAVKRPKS